jgi:hypothetical protein
MLWISSLVDYISVYRFIAVALPVAVVCTPERFKERIAQLYKQGADINCIGQYVLKWVQWTCAGINELHANNILATPEIIT